MPFVKNDTRINRKGRPRQRHLKNHQLKDALENICNGYITDIENENLSLTIKDKIQFLRYVLPYILPKLNSIGLTDESENNNIEFDIKDIFKIDNNLSNSVREA